MKNPLIVALDVPTFEEAKVLIDDLSPVVDIYKVGMQLFTAYGPFVVRYIQAKGKKVFLDLKFHDIPNTVAHAVTSAVRLSHVPHDPVDDKGRKTEAFEPLFMMTVHTQGGAEMMKAAADAARSEAVALGIKKPLIIGVTVLTSDPNGNNIHDVVLERARLAIASGLDGVVASSHETAMLRRELGKDVVIVTPGIRPKDADAGDQKRIATPREAMDEGSSYIVVGRPIVKAVSPLESARTILKELNV